jgi:hypothetical protein
VEHRPGISTSGSGTELFEYTLSNYSSDERTGPDSLFQREAPDTSPLDRATRIAHPLPVDPAGREFLSLLMAP